MAIKIGITGGIGSGKSVVAHIVNLMGIPVYDTDKRAKFIMHIDPQVRRELMNLVGDSLYADGNLKAPLLAKYMFGNPERVKKVNSIVHPRVREDFRRWTAKYSADSVVGIESAILIEAGFRSEVDKLIMVYAPLEVRIERVMLRDAASRESVLKRIKSQMSDEEKCREADFVVFNSGTCSLVSQVCSVISLISKNNPYLCR